MKIALLPNLTRVKAKDVTLEIIKWLNEYGAEIACNIDAFSPVPCKTLSELMEWCDVAISVGGDGSMLSVAKHTVDFGKPVLCINAGRLAFMAGLESNELELLGKLIDGDYDIDRRMLLDVSVQRDGKEVTSGRCINDAVLARSAQLKLTDINVDCDGKRINSYRADGIIVATPTGSSGYSLSAGGPVINPSMEAIVVTPICAQSLVARSIVFSASNEIELYPSSGEELLLSLDGEESFAILPNDKIVIRKSNKFADFIRIKNEAFFEVLNNKLAGM